MLDAADVAQRAASHADDPDVIAVTEAVNVYVESACPHALRDDDGGWAATTQLGALMLAARWVRRRNSPAGVEPGLDAGGAVYVSRYDSDIARLLRVEHYAPPVVVA